MKFEKMVFSFLTELHKFDHEMSCLDLVWNIIFPDSKGRWFKVNVTKYKETYYINRIDEETCGLEAVLNKCVNATDSMGQSSAAWEHGDLGRIWAPLIQAAMNWFKTAQNDWIRAHRRVVAEYPLKNRYGIVPNSIIRASLTDIYRIGKELGKNQCRKFIQLVENGYFMRDENLTVNSMSANDFFEYCKIAYIAGARDEDSIDKKLSGKEMYRRYADGRHEGLLDINPKSKKEFSSWIDGTHPKRSTGGHPWEIKRGGNTTHIDLSVYRPSYGDHEKFRIELRGASIGRLKETIQMFLAIQETGLPISIFDPEGIRLRLLGQDNIGIVPSYETLHRANQRFREDQHVYDVLHYDDLGRQRRRILPFIAWEHLPILKPVEI
jgi:hypothetical protein